MARTAHKYFTTWRRIAPKAVPSLSPSSHTFDAFTGAATRSRAQASTPRPRPERSRTRFLALLVTVAGATALFFLAAWALRATAPKDTWIFDQDVAQRPSLQVKHTLK
jgi:hypothetical protein